MALSGILVLHIWYEAGERRSIAHDYFVTGANLKNPEIEWGDRVYRRLGIPRALRTRESAVVHYLLLAATLDPRLESDVHLQLTTLYHDSDCPLAWHYFRLLETDPATPDVERYRRALIASCPEPARRP